MMRIFVGLLVALALAGCASPGYYAYTAPRGYIEESRHHRPQHAASSRYWEGSRVIGQPVYVVPVRPYR